jgi:signal transduction histidine kinase
VLLSAVSRPSFDQFVRQFGLSGCCLLRLGVPAGLVADVAPNLPQPPDWLAYWHPSLGTVSNRPPDRTLADSLEATIAQSRLTTAQPFEVISLELSQGGVAQPMYGCAWCHERGDRYYLLAWQPTPLSEHQQYGLSLYARAMSAQVASSGVDAQLQEVLRRNQHQLRTPLALMLIYTDLLKTVADDSQSQVWVHSLRTMIDDMHTSLNHLTELASSTESRDWVDLRPAIAQCIQGMQPWIEQKQLTVRCDSQPLWVQVNEWKLKQVVQNLLSNAIAFSPSGGQITWEWQIFQTEVLIKVCDQGPGLSAEDLRLLGTPFYSRRPGGTGLGLLIAQQIVVEHHGSLWGDNVPDGGAQFCITLPKQS